MTGYFPAELRRRVIEHFGNCCAYCRSADDLMVTIFEIEHIMPRALSGRSVFENLCLACPNCNRYKSDRVLATDPVTGGEAPLFHPQRDRWEDHFGWSSDFAEIISFTSTGRGTCALLRMNRPQLIRVRRLWVAVGEHPPERRHS